MADLISELERMADEADAEARARSLSTKLYVLLRYYIEDEADLVGVFATVLNAQTAAQHLAGGYQDEMGSPRSPLVWDRTGTNGWLANLQAGDECYFELTEQSLNTYFDYYAVPRDVFRLPGDEGGQVVTLP